MQNSFWCPIRAFSHSDVICDASPVRSSWPAPGCMTAPQAAALSRAEALGGSGKVFLELWYFPYFCVLKRKSLRLTGTFHFPICLPVLAWGTQGGQVEEVAPVCRDDPPACPGLITQLSAMTAVMMAPMDFRAPRRFSAAFESTHSRTWPLWG